MDSFVVKYTDPLAVIKNQSELHLKDKEEPPVKKIRHDDEFSAVVSNKEVILEENLDTTVEDMNDSESHNKSTEMNSENSISNGSPECEYSERDKDECKIIEEKDKVSPPQQKRRKISLKEKEERLKEKEEAKLLKEKKLQEKKQEKEEMRQKKDQERLEKEKEKQARKEQIEKERLEKEREKQIKKEKLEKERLEKQKKKEELNLAKEEERKKREEEKRQKEEERKQKEEEKRKKDEERKLKEEEEQRRKDKVKESFKSFFIKKSPPKKVATSDEKCQLFAPFEVKPNMTMAPVLRRKQIENCEMFLGLIENQDSNILYINELRKRITKEKIQYRSGRYLRHLLSADENEKTDQDIIIVDEDGDEDGDENGDEKSKPERDLDAKNVMPVKLLQFSENYRPPYYGTWRKRSKKISPRNPFKKDEELLNYEIDSDEEWEEEEPGESLSGTEHEDEEEEEEDNDGEDDGFFVPHGYLSDDEGVNGSDGEKEEEHVDIRDKKLDKTEGFPFGSKGKMKQLRATCFGSAWFTADDDVPAFLAVYKVKPMINAPIDIFTIKQETWPKSSNQDSGQEIVTPRSGNNLPLKVPEEAMPMLIKHVHKSNFGVNKLIRTFLAMWNQERNENDDVASSTRPRISKRQLERKILEIAKRDTFAESSKPCYFVHKHVLDAYDTDMDSLQNESRSVNNNMVTNTGCTITCNVSGTTDTSFDIKYATQRCETVPSQDDRSKNDKSRSSLPSQNLHKPEEEVNKTHTQREIIII